MLEKLLEAVWETAKDVPALLIGFIGGMLWMRAMYLPLLRKQK